MKTPAPLSAAFGSIALSLPADVPISGFYRRDPGRSRLGPEILEFSYCILRSPDHCLAYFLGDFLYFPNYLRDRLSKISSSVFQLRSATTITAGTHTHGGPEMGFLYRDRPREELQESLFQQIAPILLQLREEDFSPVTVQYFAIRLDEPISVGRRRVSRWFPGRVFRAPDPDTTPDPVVYGLKIRRNDKRVLLLASFASHPVFHTGPEPSGDYPGAVRRQLKKLHPETELLLFNGFAGDLRPNYTTRRPGGQPLSSGWWRDLAKSLLVGSRFKEYSKHELEMFCAVLVNGLQRALSDTSSEHLALSAVSETAIPVPKLRDGRTLDLRIHRFGPVLLLALNAELFSEYLSRLEQDFPQFSFLSISCAGDSIGYLPTDEALAHGGYEIDEAPVWNGMEAPFTAEELAHIYETVCGAIKALEP